MQVTCSSCGRSFDVDRERARTLRSARCPCGADIDLRADAAAQRLGKYVLEERIAVGGMGEIFRAKMAGIEGFEREVAIKKMLPHLSADRDFVTMLVNEAKLTVLLHHPNIVQVYDLAKEGDEYYIAMEYVPSVNLSALLEYCATRGVYTPVPLAVSVTLQTLEALEYAHTLAGSDGQPMHLLHRDVTPQNILVTRDGWVKVTDFGIAKAKNEISTTRPGTIRGKLGYIAPEQLQSSEADQRVDIFCAGIVLWESLATRRLFKGNDEVDTLRLIVETKVPSLTTLRNDVGSAVDAVVARALARDPEQRYASAAAFRDALLAAISPDTADDYLKAAKRFLGDEGELFERKLARAAEPSDNPTVAIGGTPSEAPESGSVAVTDLVSRPPRARRRLPLLLGAVTVMALIAAGVAAWSWRERGTVLPFGGTPMTQAEVQAAVDGLRDQLETCYDGRLSHDLEPRATVAVLASGQVAQVELGPAALGKSAECLSSVIRGIQMRAHPETRFRTTVKLPAPVERARDGAAEPAGDRRPLGPEEIQKTVLASFTPIARCLGQLGSAPDTVTAHLTILPTGRVATVELAPPLDNAGASRCLVTTIKNMRFRSAAKGVEVSIPLLVQRYTRGN